MSIVNLQTQSLDGENAENCVAEVILRGNLNARELLAQIRTMPGIGSASRC